MEDDISEEKMTQRQRRRRALPSPRSREREREREISPKLRVFEAEVNQK